jgi:hypothetical protein
MKKNNFLFVLIATAILYLAAQAGAAYLGIFSLNSLVITSEALRMFLVAGIFGILIPIIESRKLSLPYDRPSTPTRVRAGIALSATALAIEIAFFSSWFIILEQNPEDLTRIKHILTTLPVSIAISLLFYFVIPEAIDRVFGRATAAKIFMAFIPGIALGFTLYAETGFSRFDVLAVMTLVGALAAAGNILTGKFFVTFVTLFLAVYANSLAAMRYIDYSWPVAVFGFMFCMIMLLTGFNIPMRRLTADRA